MTGWLEVARRVHHDSAPSEFEVHRAAQRVLARMNQGRAPRFWRRPLLALALLFAGGLAYAASLLGRAESGSSALPTSALPASALPASALPKASALPAGKLTAEARRTSELAKPAAAQMGRASALSAVSASASATPDSESRQVQATGPTSAATQGGRAEERRAHGRLAEPARSSWHDVESAMNAKDYVRAERALHSLAGSSDLRSRENAILGLAQLAVGRGDCKSALTLLARVEQTATSADTRRRARELSQRCR